VGVYASTLFLFLRKIKKPESTINWISINTIQFDKTLEVANY
jgi:hypothetical protein